VSKENPNRKTDAGNGDGPPSPKRDAPLGDKVRVAQNTSGRVTFDDRGNAVWEWSVATGAFGLEISTSRLKKLEVPGLSLAEDTPDPAIEFEANKPGKLPVKPGPVAPNPKGAAQGYSPYDSGLLTKSKSSAPPKKDLRRLSEWLKLRKQAGNNNQDED
jgi:hypothetical protein